MISIIIVNWNGQKWLKICLDSLSYQDYSDFEIILVDNGSTDNSLKFIGDNYPKIVVIENKENLGFGRANNLGAERAKGELLLFLNNDIIIEDQAFLRKILRYKLANGLNLVGPRILSGDKSDFYQGKYLTIDPFSYSGLGKNLFYLEGCALLISAADFHSLGGFDDRYFMYSEDIDLCWRAHLYGLQLGICREAELIHFGGGSSDATMFKKRGEHIVPMFRRREVEKNNLRNILKNYRLVNLVWVLPLFIAQDLAELTLYLLTGNFSMFRELIKALWWNLLNIGDTIKQRTIIQKKRTVSDFHVLSFMNLRINKIKAFLDIGLPKFK